VVLAGGVVGAIVYSVAAAAGVPLAREPDDMGEVDD
jgi:hypothetical protein